MQCGQGYIKLLEARLGMIEKLIATKGPTKNKTLERLQQRIKEDIKIATEKVSQAQDSGIDTQASTDGEGEEISKGLGEEMLARLYGLDL